MKRDRIKTLLLAEALICAMLALALWLFEGDAFSAAGYAPICTMSFFHLSIPCRPFPEIRQNSPYFIPSLPLSVNRRLCIFPPKPCRCPHGGKVSRAPEFSPLCLSL